MDPATLTEVPLGDPAAPIVDARDVWLWDAGGERLLDAACSIWHASVGHRHPQILAAMARAPAALHTYSSFHRVPTAEERELALRLEALAPASTPRLQLNRGGWESVTAAIALARRHWRQRGEPQRHAVLSRRRSGVGGAPRPGMRDARCVEEDTLAAMRREVEAVGPESLAAIVAEPVLGGEEVLAPPAGYLGGLGELCAESGAILVLDASICGFGRLGTWFGIERWGVEPDLIAFADGITGGYAPLGGVMMSEALAESCFDAAERAAGLARLAGGHPAAAATALANLSLLEQDGLLARGWELEGELAEALAPLAELPAVARVRAGTGAIASVHFEPAFLASLPAGIVSVLAAVRQRGVVVRACGEAISVALPLAAQREHLYLLADALLASCRELR